MKTVNCSSSTVPAAITMWSSQKKRALPLSDDLIIMYGGSDWNEYVVRCLIVNTLEKTTRFAYNTDDMTAERGVGGMISDEELYRQYLCGNETGLEALMRKYGDPLTLYINCYLHDVHEAEDLMIEVFSYLFTKKPRIRDGGLKAYLYKAARHMALRHKNRRRLFFNLDDLTEEPDGQTPVDEVVRTKERDQILHFCMDELNPDYREALYLTYFEGMSYLQAAEVMEKSEKQITNMVYRGKERLRGLLEREGITNAKP